MKAKSNITAFVCLGLLFSIYGCGALVAGGAAAGATYVYTEGWVERDYNTSLDSSYEAVMAAVQDMNMTVEEKSKEISSAEIKTKKGDEDYWIRMEEKNENLTTISIRAGLMGDRQASQKIHQEIEQAL